jgi:anti-anti-sigma factor
MSGGRAILSPTRTAVSCSIAAPQAYNPRIVVANSIAERSIGDVTILDVPSQVMFYEGAALLRTRITELVDEGRRKLLLDLRRVDYLDSFGVGVIASKYVSVRGKGGDLKLLHPSARSLHVLGIAGLLKILESFDDEEAAVRSFESDPRT